MRWQDAQARRPCLAREVVEILGDYETDVTLILEAEILEADSGPIPLLNEARTA